MKISEIKSKNFEDLKKLLGEKRQALKDFRFGMAGSKIKNVKEGQNIRKDIARILTELNLRSKGAVNLQNQ